MDYFDDKKYVVKIVTNKKSAVHNEDKLILIINTYVQLCICQNKNTGPFDK